MNGVRKTNSNNNSNILLSGATTTTTGGRGGSSSSLCFGWFWIAVLTLSNMLVYQLAHLQPQQQLSYLQQLSSSSSSSSAVDESLIAPLLKNNNNQYSNNYLTLPQGIAQALPSIPIADVSEKKNVLSFRKDLYGGVDDGKHLGGFTEMDLQGISPATWKYMITYFGIRSIMDVGCGRGISTSWFLLHGVNAICIEGSSDARSKTVLPHPDTQMIQHDFSRGPWWPPHQTYDAVWCVEFLEHVGRNYHHNYLPAFRKAALLFVTHSKWGGWHHVEVHDPEWWIYKFESYGFQYSESLTQRIRNVARMEYTEGYMHPNHTHVRTPHGDDTYNAQHVWLTMLVFINPLVASLPQHAHLFAEPGCFVQRQNGKLVTRPCGEPTTTSTNMDPTSITNVATPTEDDANKEDATTLALKQQKLKLETPLPPNYKPLILTPDMDMAWDNLIRKQVVVKPKTPRTTKLPNSKHVVDYAAKTNVNPNHHLRKTASMIATANHQRRVNSNKNNTASILIRRAATTSTTTNPDIAASPLS